MMNALDYLTLTLHFLSGHYTYWFGVAELNFPLQQFVYEYDYVQLLMSAAFCRVVQIVTDANGLQ